MHLAIDSYDMTSSYKADHFEPETIWVRLDDAQHFGDADEFVTAMFPEARKHATVPGSWRVRRGSVHYGIGWLWFIPNKRNAAAIRAFAEAGAPVSDVIDHITA